MKAWKIVEVVDGNIRTLFHGLDGSRTVPTGKWLKAERKLGSDGTGKRKYFTGWHVLLSKADAEEYLKVFTTRLHLLKIVECEIGGYRPKEHSPSPVYLSNWLTFGEIR